jgi:GTP cyclohydrolase FolE2
VGEKINFEVVFHTNCPSSYEISKGGLIFSKISKIVTNKEA